MLFSHTGDLGDVLYALPTIKALGGGDLALYRAENVREPFDRARAESLAALLRVQPYIRNVFFSESRPKADVDFADWRTGYDGFENLAYSQAKAFGVDPKVCDEPWLTVPDPVTIEPAGKRRPVVVVRSHRYRQHDFPWAAIAAKYRDEAVCLGTVGEVEELTYGYGFTFALQTPTLLEFARVIAGAELVVTNQTCAYAIAEGLHKRVALERWPVCPNVDFPAREGLYVGERINEVL